MKIYNLFIFLITLSKTLILLKEKLNS